VSSICCRPIYLLCHDRSAHKGRAGGVCQHRQSHPVAVTSTQCSNCWSQEIAKLKAENSRLARSSTAAKAQVSMSYKRSVPGWVSYS
jgi:hypothetical protein